VCGARSAAAIAAEIAAASGCCPTLCATVFTTGDELVTVPEFDLAVEDGQYVMVTVTGYAVRTDANNSGDEGGFVYLRALARRYDADVSFPGLNLLQQDKTLQVLSAGLDTDLSSSGNTLQVQLDGAVGEYRWDLEMNYCIRDQIVDTVVA
jgi:hypothetical protein